METATKLEKKEIFIDTEAFNNEQNNYNRKKQIELEIRKEIKRLTKQTVSSSFYRDITENFYKLIERTYKNSNPMNLKGRKLVMLLDIDTTTILNLDRQYQSYKNAIEPSLVKHTIYAETPEELKRYNACMKVINACKELNKYIKVFPVNVQQASSNAIRFNMRDNKLVVNHRWIKGLNL